jgi:hypothetical protein
MGNVLLKFLAEHEPAAYQRPTDRPLDHVSRSRSVLGILAFSLPAKCAKIGKALSASEMSIEIPQCSATTPAPGGD